MLLRCIFKDTRSILWNVGKRIKGNNNNKCSRFSILYDLFIPFFCSFSMYLQICYFFSFLISRHIDINQQTTRKYSNNNTTHAAFYFLLDLTWLPCLRRSICMLNQKKWKKREEKKQTKKCRGNTRKSR